MRATQVSNVSVRHVADRPFWDARSGVFDGGQLREAIVLRGWTVAEFAQTGTISLACLYNALAGKGVSDRTAIRIFRVLAQRQPMAHRTVDNVP